MLLAALQKGKIGQGDVRVSVKQRLLRIRQVGGKQEELTQTVTLGQLAQPVGALGE